jgi:hypothetical protein
MVFTSPPIQEMDIYKVIGILRLLIQVPKIRVEPYTMERVTEKHTN